MPLPQIVGPDGALLAQTFILSSGLPSEKQNGAVDQTSTLLHAHIYGQLYKGGDQRVQFKLVLADLSRAGAISSVDIQHFNPFQDSPIQVSVWKEPWPLWVMVKTIGPTANEGQPAYGSKALFPSDWTIAVPALEFKESTGLIKLSILAGFEPLKDVEAGVNLI